MPRPSRPVVGTGAAAGGFARRLDGGEKKSNQDRDNRDDNQELDQGESTRARVIPTNRRHSAILQIEEGGKGTSRTIIDGDYRVAAVISWNREIETPSPASWRQMSRGNLRAQAL